MRLPAHENTLKVAWTWLVFIVPLISYFGNQANAEIVRWACETQFIPLIKQGESYHKPMGFRIEKGKEYKFRIKHDFPSDANPKNIRLAGIKLFFMDDDSFPHFNATNILTKHTRTGFDEKTSQHLYYATKIITSTTTQKEIKTHTYKYRKQKRDIALASVGNSSRQGSNYWYKLRIMKRSRIAGEKTVCTKYTNSMNNCPHNLYMLNLFTAKTLTNLSLIDDEKSPFFNYSDWIDYKEDQWEKFENLKTIMFREDVYEGFYIDLPLKAEITSLVSETSVDILRIKGLEGSTMLLNSGELWIEYEPAVPSTPNDLKIK